MNIIYISSIEPHSGKSMLTCALSLLMKEKGIRVGYFKPLGTLPIRINDTVADEDALFFKSLLNLRESPDILCPILFTQDLIEKVYMGKEKDLNEKVLSALKEVSKEKDGLIAGGVGSVISTGSLFGLPGKEIAELMDAKIIVIGKYKTYTILDEFVSVQNIIGSRLIGFIINDIPESQLYFIQNFAVPYLEEKELKILGCIPRDSILNSVSISELIKNLFAEVLCCTDKLEEMVEHFSIGAMSVDNALQYFKKTPNKAVITGGDRPDIQIAALETSTKCLILTGNLRPNNIIISRAQEREIPILLVKEDTLSTIEKVEGILGKLRVREEKKIKRAKELLKEYVDVNKIFKSIGIK